MKILKRLTENIFPSNFTCIICDEELNTDRRYGMCDYCLQKVPFITNNACRKCGAQLIADETVCLECKNVIRALDKNYSAVMYDETMKPLIHSLKYNNKKYLAKYLGKLLYDKFVDVLDDFEPDIIIPVPISENRLKYRGFNQTELLLTAFESHKDLIRTDLLIRIKDTPNLAKLTKKERLESIKDAFKVLDEDTVKNKNILLVDDIFTSGATSMECCRVLKGCKADTVRSLTLANAQDINMFDNK